MSKRKKENYLNIELQIKKIKRITVIVAGFTILALGAVSLFTPLPGILLIFVGLTLLSAEFLWAGRAIRKIKLGVNNIQNSAKNHINHLRKEL